MANKCPCYRELNAARFLTSYGPTPIMTDREANLSAEKPSQHKYFHSNLTIIPMSLSHTAIISVNPHILSHLALISGYVQIFRKDQYSNKITYS